MALFGSLSTLRAQAPQTPGFSAAFAYVEDLLRPDSPARARLRGITSGSSQKIELAGGAYAIEQVYATKPRAEGVFESHRKYIDVQVIVEGDEQMEVIDLGHCTLRQAYDAEKDFMLHLDHPAASKLRLGPGEGAIFFPVDVHMPTLQAGPVAALVRKTVVKVPVA